MGQKGKIAKVTIMKQAKARRHTVKTEPEMPLGLDQAAQDEWGRVTGLLRSRGALDALDASALADYVQCWSRLRECEAVIQKEGLLIPGERGSVKNPAAQLARNYRASMVTWAREIGLTFASRQRIGVPEAGPEFNPFSKEVLGA